MRSSTRLRSVLAGLTTLVCLTTGCAASAPTQESRVGPSEGVVQRDAPLAGRASVVAVSVDGLTPAAVRQLGRRGAPALHTMLRQGTGTLNARTLRELTNTLPNHASMLTGRRAAGRRGHGVTVNDDPGGTVRRLAGRPIASMFDVVDDHGGRTALYASKSKFKLFDRSWSIDRYQYTGEGRLVSSLLQRLRQKPDALSFLHLALPDEAGHEDGFGSRSYLSAVRRADALVGSVLRTIESRPDLRRTTTVVLTADHGGSGRDHDEVDSRKNFAVPFVAWGAGAARGADLYRLNPRRQPPGRSRTDYRGPQPIRSGDLANLATDLLGLPPVPGSRFNADQRLRIDR